ncbi:multiple sugar transport system substrate-binding protein [Aequitasia blattaphilus]|uniref:Sugar ABC transporter substrate-binding protein n=1 Tax=Aequitasia blattaphilus TaxID=2949332 RepID=A0ABT1E4S9_9FIRM|nr:sugar ABC transporter substrate-binding protein [Aequitasia blattaphilus]MCP1100849.1 sugar ABC transporter substrate-binding protein [Aequitasia blattaphilus]MCR8613489.1 sugar ABC transporter substrate-binding protein [Aequitasia blattaphilus]
MRKRIISMILVLTLLLLTVVGCTNSKDTKTGETSTKKKSITLAIWDKVQEPGIRKICDDFTEKTGIKVDIQITPWDQYWTMLEAGATGGSLPDVFWMHVREIEKYARADMLLDLSSRIEQSSEISLDNYFEDVTAVYQYDGKQYAIPKDIDTIALWYNKTHFDEAGISYPDDTWTWEDLKTAAETLSNDEHKGFGSRIKNYQESWYNLVYGNGGFIINEGKTKSGFDDPKTVESIEYFVNLVKDGSSPDNTVTAETDLIALFESGAISMSLMGSWTAGELTGNDYVKENCAVASIPMTEDGTRVSIYNGLGYAAAENTENEEEAWALIEYLGSKEAQEKQAEYGVTLSAYQGASEKWASHAEGFDLSPYIDVMEDTLVFYPHSTNTTAWEDMAMESLVEAWNGTKSTKDVCAEIAGKMNTLLEEE